MSDRPADTIMELSMGFTIPRALHVVTQLGIPDAIGETPRNIDDLAAATGTNSGILNRSMRLLAAHGVFEKNGTSYAHSPASRLLRSDHPQSMRSWVVMQGLPVLWRIWEHLDYSLKTGRSASEALPNGGFWEYMTGNPEAGRLFNDAMTNKSRAQTAGILAAYDFSRFKTLADIGGGNGYLLKAVLEATPGLHGVLFDLPTVIDQNSAAATERLKLQGGDFFKSDLPVCDAYLLMQILHDWSDEDAERILKAIRRAAASNAKLLIAEWLIPEDGRPNWTLLIDMIIMAQATGKERTVAEFKDLLGRAGFRLDRVIEAGFNTFILESSAV
ncbi:MAG TPA: methyltransferase [Bryobacteraceae bacterium]|nr:methyltransferase [Bryobacteraceae bacterium]